LALALILAAINQVFSLLDPWIFRKVIDEYVTKFESKSKDEFIEDISNAAVHANITFIINYY
jgi:ATP-binding cassette subfamily B protein